jgi:hypothetical protein
MTDKKLRNLILENYLIDEDQEVLIPNGYADAFIGITDLEPKRAVYDKRKMIEIVMIEDKCDETEAIEWLEFNTWNAYVGENTPLYIDTI